MEPVTVEALSIAIEDLRAEVAALRKENQELRARKERPTESLRQYPGDHEEAETAPSVGPVSRRGIFKGVMAGSVAAALGLVVARPLAASADTSSGEPLSSAMNFETPIDAFGNFPALASSITWSRLHNQGPVPGATDQILSLIHEGKGPGAFPWSLYIQLTSQTDPVGNAVGSYVRLFNEESGWAASYHTDLLHIGQGTSIGVNVELTRTADTANLPGSTFPALPAQPAGRAIGMNILNAPGYGSDTNGDQAINIQGAPGRSWDTVLNVESGNQGTDSVAIDGAWQNSVHLKGSGTTGLLIDGQYSTGIQLDDNDIQMTSGSRLYLGDGLYLWLNTNLGRLEVVYEPRGVVGYIDLKNSPSHEL